MKAALIAAVMLAMFGAVPAAAADTVYVIRHLQKADGADPALTAEGSHGAQALARLLADRNVEAIYATATRRAHDTAAPLAKQLGLSVTTYDPRDPDALVKAAAAIDGAILVVGHSNTVPDLVARFGGERPADIDESQYGTLYIVEDGKVQQLHLPH